MRHTLLLLTLATAACGLPFGIEDQELPMTVTDAGSYVLSVHASTGEVTLAVPFTLTNATDEVLTMVHCGKEEPDFSRRSDQAWEIVPGGPELGCLSLTHVQPGTTFDGTARVWWDASTTPAELEGTYRLHWGRLWAEWHDYDNESETWGTRLPEEALVSNTFVVIAP